MPPESKQPSQPVSPNVIAREHASALLRPFAALNGLAPRMKRGDREALALLYDETCAIVYGLTLRILGEAADAQEAMLEAYTRAWSRIHTFDPDRSGLMAWLILLARTAALERQPRRESTGQTAASGESDRQIVERAFFQGSKDEGLRGALTRLRQKGEGA
jgi:DNA-directed RNA polymerase specialized sigma24 family protein